MGVGIALVGSGFALRVQLPAFRLVPGAEVRALVGRDAARAAQAARAHGIPLGTARLDEVLARDDIDLVCIATPPDLHRDMAEAALAGGKHVLCEKPMALDAAEAASMCRAAERAPGLALLDHQLRFSTNLLKMRRLLREGYLGTPFHVQVQIRSGRRLDARRPFDWWSEVQRGGGVLGAFGSHALDWLRWTFGEIESVCCEASTCIPERAVPGEVRPRPVDADEYAATWLRFAGPAPLRAAVLLSTVAHRGGGTRIEIFGSEGTLVHDDEGRLWGSRRDPGARSDHEQAPLEDLGDTETLPADFRRVLPDGLWTRAFATLARELVGALREEPRALLPPDAATFADGLAVQQVLDALRRSLRSGAWERSRPPA